MSDLVAMPISPDARIRHIVRRCPAFGAVVEKVSALDYGVTGATDLADRLEGEKRPDFEKLSALLGRMSPVRKQALADFFEHALPTFKISWETAAVVLEHDDGGEISFAKSELEFLTITNPAVLDIWWALAESQETDEAEFTVHYAAACVARLHRTHFAAHLLERKGTLMRCG